MPRKPRKSKNMRHPLTDGELHLLLTGRPYPDKAGNWPDGSSWLRPFILCSPAGRDELRALWLRHKDSILQDWKGPGRPWAQTEFEGVSHAT